MLCRTCSFEYPDREIITVTGKSLSDYLARRILEIVVNDSVSGYRDHSPTEYDVLVNVYGGGTTGQAGAIRHGIARALIVARPAEAGSQEERIPHT